MNHTVFDITGDSSESVQLFTLLKPHTEIWVIIKLARLVMVAEVGLVGKKVNKMFSKWVEDSFYRKLCEFCC